MNLKAPKGALQADAAFLTQHPSIGLLIDGHCDERGSIEYNLALGDKRAASVKGALTDGHKCRSDKDGQLWQSKAFVHQARRILLAAKSPRHFVYQNDNRDRVGQ
jgi:hypothetical protein